MGFCTKCHTTTGNARHENTYFKKLDRNNPNSVPDNCTYDMDCPGEHPCCILVDKATMCGKCESYYKGVCMNCNVGGEVDVVLPREKTDIFDHSNCTHTAIFKLGRLFNMLKMFSLSNINH